MLSQQAIRLYQLATLLAAVVVFATLLKWTSLVAHMTDRSPLGHSEAQFILGFTTVLSCVTLILYPILSEGLSRVNPRNRKTRTIVILSFLIAVGLIQPVISHQLPDWMRLLRLVQIGSYVATGITVVKLRRSFKDANAAS